ncbi:MAG: hypothetical protein ACTSRG_18335 [Candidatus Helarchaeota archaeon]
MSKLYKIHKIIHDNGKQIAKQSNCEILGSNFDPEYIYHFETRFDPPPHAVFLCSLLKVFFDALGRFLLVAKT